MKRALEFIRLVEAQPVPPKWDYEFVVQSVKGFALSDTGPGTTVCCERDGAICEYGPSAVMTRRVIKQDNTKTSQGDKANDGCSTNTDAVTSGGKPKTKTKQPGTPSQPLERLTKRRPTARKKRS